jgi:hypothetical protein
MDSRCIKLVRLYLEWSKIDGCQEIEKASIRLVWAVILKEALINLKGMYANEGEERLRKTTKYLISNRCLQPKIWTSCIQCRNAQLICDIKWFFLCGSDPIRIAIRCQLMKGKESVAVVQEIIVRRSSAVELKYSKCSYGKSVHFLMFKFLWSATVIMNYINLNSVTFGHLCNVACHRNSCQFYWQCQWVKSAETV